ncbi:hypothetical protein DQ04_09641010 [Trypanosoma grayi]|uniref:hypothetical protein n=1 Tax=Trypanosoma grayi TaxID=71804 RepID=UPI0004F476B2|nr:hypothetical protein DQ04_09641010 [Trypanosoma grayi]KEG07492.1 hypothetical protein DQ04_09641010 [Trypanosoma grayi]
MRGGFRRGRFDKVPQPGTIGSYTEALYPPRAYHYYTQRSLAATPTGPTVIVPSIDDGVGDSRGREVSTQGTSPVMHKKSIPLLRDFVDCFIDGNQYVGDTRAFAVVDAGSEPLNMLHYPYLLCSNTVGDGISPTAVTGNQFQNDTAGYPNLRLWEEVLGLPNELRIYSALNARGEMTGFTGDRLRIRPVKRKRVVKPVRRGAKVIVLAALGDDGVPETRRVKRGAGDEDAQDGGAKAQLKQEDDDAEEERGGDFDKDDDEASLSFQVDDDDDGGDLDGPEGSGGEDDFF